MAGQPVRVEAEISTLTSECGFVLPHSKRVEANLQDLTTKSEKKKIEVRRDLSASSSLILRRESLTISS